MRRLALVALALVWLAGSLARPAPAKDLQQLEYLEALIATLVPPDQGTYRRHSLPQFVGSRVFRSGRVYPFLLEYELPSWPTLFETVRRLYDFHEVDMYVYPQESQALVVFERRDAPRTRTWRTRFNVALFEGRREPGFESYSLWERPFPVELHVFDEREAITFIDQIREFRAPGLRFDLDREFSLALTPDIDPDGRRYLLLRFRPFLINSQRAGNERAEEGTSHFAVRSQGSYSGDHSPWDPDGAWRGALDQLLDIPRFERGWLAPEGAATTTIWLQELRATTDPDGSLCWHFQGAAAQPKAVSGFVKELRDSGWYERVSVDSLVTRYLPGIDRLVTYFRLAARPLQ